MSKNGMTARGFRRHLDLLGLNQQQAAELLGKTDRTIRRYASGEVDVPTTVERFLMTFQPRRARITRTDRPRINR